MKIYRDQYDKVVFVGVVDRYYQAPNPQSIISLELMLLDVFIQYGCLV